MKSLLFAAVALAAFATPALAGTSEYRTISGDRDVGGLIVDHTGNKVTVTYDIKDNGRGPTVDETILLASDGSPADWKITGRTTFGNLIKERYARSGNGASWTDLSGPGKIAGKDAPRYYVAQNGSPLDRLMLAKALLADSDHAMAVAPGGTATLTERDRRWLEGPLGKVEVVTYELGGLSLNPTYVMLDSAGEPFGIVTARSIMARKGWERIGDAPMRALVEKLNSERLARLQSEGGHRYAGPVTITNVRVFDAARKALTAPMDVTVAGNRISEIAPAGSTPPDAGITRIDGNGGTLVPGMYEMHAHVDANEGLLNVLAGVTTMRDMGNDNAALDQVIARIDKGEIAGPRVIRSGFIEGKSQFNANSGRIATSQAEAIDHVRWYAARGFHQVKLYSSMTGAWAPAIAAEAHRLGMKVVGHTPAFSTTDKMLAAGFDEVTHINQLMLSWVIKPDEDTRTLFRFTAMRRFPALDLNSEKVRHTLDFMVAHHIAHDPTIGIHELGMTAVDGKPNPGAVDYIDHMPPAEQRELRQALFGADTPQIRAEYIAAYAKVIETLTELNRRGIMLLPGTDLGGAFTYHRELELYNKIGLSNAEILTRATLDMARYNGQDQSLGSIERGKLADFFLVPGDPVKDLKAIKSIAMVVKDGTVYFPSEIYPKLGIRPFTAVPKLTPAR